MIELVLVLRRIFSLRALDVRLLRYGVVLRVLPFVPRFRPVRFGHGMVRIVVLAVPVPVPFRSLGDAGAQAELGAVLLLLLQQEGTGCFGRPAPRCRHRQGVTEGREWGVGREGEGRGGEGNGGEGRRTRLLLAIVI